MNDLVERLSQGKHPVDFESRTEEIAEIKERLENGFVFVTFTDTRGGTELGIDIDPALTNFKEADFANGEGKIKVVGTCELDYQKVRCITEVELSTKKGTGYLEVLDDKGKTVTIH